MDPLSAIFNYLRLSDRIATAGQPTAEQLADVARAGFEVVINLGMPDEEEAIADERGIVQRLGMAYEPIPVIWEHPTHSDLERFFKAMEGYEGNPVFVHCIANFRVSAFMLLYRVLRLDWPLEDAIKSLSEIWEPNETWQAFIDSELARRLRVHMTEAPEPAEVAYLRSRLDPRVDLTVGPRSPDPAGYHVLVDDEPTHDKLAASPHLRAVIIPYTGVPPETRELLRRFPQVALHNSHHPAQATAEVAFALLLAAAKHLLPLDRALRAADWSLRYRSFPSVVLAHKTALILGYGEIGQRVARMCRGFDMRVLATRRSPAPPDGDPEALDPLPAVEGFRREGVEVHSPEALHSLLPRANFLIVALPLTDRTRGLIGERELALLPPSAVLVNVGRGPVIDEGALYRSLKEGKLLAAGLDVWYNYPADKDATANTPPSAYPFGELANVVLSPHRGGFAPEEAARRARMDDLAETINALARGEPAPNRIDLDKGY